MSRNVVTIQPKTTNGGKEKPPTRERHQKKSRKIRSGITMSMTSLLDSADETVLAAGAVAGVDDLESSWVMTGIAIAVKGMMMTSRWRLARRVSQSRRRRGIIWSCLR